MTTLLAILQNRVVIRNSDMSYITDTRSPVVVNHIFGGIEVMCAETGVPLVPFSRFVSCRCRLQCFSLLGAEFGGPTLLKQ
jgi:hypothetical protein